MRTPRAFLPFLFVLSLAASPTEPMAWVFSGERLAPEKTYSAEAGYGYDLGTRPGTDGAPFYFSVRLPEGTYAVQVTLGGAADSRTTVKAESRQLVLEAVATPAGGTAERTFWVNLRQPALPPPPRNAPGGASVQLGAAEAAYLRWDDRLTLEFSGEHPSVSNILIQKTDAPVLFLLGDSTVTDQNFEPGASWGQMLPRFLTGLAVANHAESGETLKSFLAELRLAKVLSQARPGDFALLQFGHNDQKRQWPQTYVEARTTYKAYLRVYVEELRLRGVQPILVTSVQRRNFDERGRIVDSHGDYPPAVREVAAELGVPLIDLEQATRSFYEALGPRLAPLAFSDGGRDLTHHNNYGAYEIAKIVAQVLREQAGPLARHVAPDFPGYDPTKPDDPARFSLPASIQRSAVKPRGN